MLPKMLQTEIEFLPMRCNHRIVGLLRSDWFQHLLQNNEHLLQCRNTGCGTAVGPLGECGEPPLPLQPCRRCPAGSCGMGI